MVAALRVVNFRSHGSFALDSLSEKAVLISGANGSGKTSLLEAVSAFNPGRGLRGELPAMATRAARGVGGWLVEAEFAPPLSLLLTMDWDAAARRRRLFLNRAKRYPLSHTAPRLPILWLHPGGDRLPATPPASRLKFLDRLAAVFDRNHSARLLALDKRQAERKRLLAEQPPKGGRGQDGRWLAVLERSMAEDAVAIAASRLELCRQLNELGSGLKSLPTARVSVNGIAEQLAGRMPALAAEDEFAAMLERQRGGTTGKSPWYGGLEFSKGEPASTGEQKLLTLSLIFAAAALLQKRLGLSPILLLDELPAHLDEQARRLALRMCGKLRTQTWLTTTEPQLVEPHLPKDATHIRLRG